MTSTYYIVFLITAIAAAVFLIAGIAMFFIFNVPKIIGLLTGYTAKKQIKQLKNGDKPVQNNNGYSDHLDTFMEKQRNMAGETRSENTTTTNFTSSMPTDTVDLKKNSDGKPVTNILAETNKIGMPETTCLEDETTGNLSSEDFKFEIVFDLNFINTDEVI